MIVGMYKLIFVEDEEMIRKVFPLMIDWKTVGFELVGVAENGLEALKIMSTMSVDVVLTDIRMPIINGLELACEVKTRYPRVKTILLSAYSDFENARKAIEYGIYGYLLKSDDEAEIQKYFAALTQTLDRETEILLNSGWVGNEMSILRNHFLKKLLTDNTSLNITEIEALATNYCIIANERYTSVIIQFDEYYNLLKMLGNARVKGIQKLFSGILVTYIEALKKGYVIEVEEYYVAFLLGTDIHVNQMVEDIYYYLTSELELIEEAGEMSLTFAVGQSVSGLMDLKVSFESALTLFKHKVYLGNSQILNGLYLIGSFCVKNLNPAQMISFENKLKQYIDRNDIDGMFVYLNEIEKYLIENKFTDIDQIFTFIAKIVMNTRDSIYFSRTNSDELFQEANAVLEYIGKCETYNSLFKTFREYAAKVLEQPHEKEPKEHVRKIIEKAVVYINQNYSKQISLEDVAKHVNVHAVHISRLFSQQLGMNYKELVTKLRMDKAKEMLADIDVKIYEICEAIGYNKPRYFSELFKKTTGLTPLEFREKCRKQE